MSQHPAPADLLAIPLTAAAYIYAIPGNGAVAAGVITSACAMIRLAFYQGLAYRLLRRDPSGRHWSATAGMVNNTPEMAGSAV